MNIALFDDKFRTLRAWGGTCGNTWFHFYPDLFKPHSGNTFLILKIHFFGTVEPEDILCEINAADEFSVSFDGDFCTFLENGFAFNLDEGGYTEVQGADMVVRYAEPNEYEFLEFIEHLRGREGKLINSHLFCGSRETYRPLAIELTSKILRALETIGLQASEAGYNHIKLEAEILTLAYKNSVSEA